MISTVPFSKEPTYSTFKTPGKELRTGTTSASGAASLMP
jgi:hypothetical protein